MLKHDSSRAAASRFCAAVHGSAQNMIKAGSMMSGRGFVWCAEACCVAAQNLIKGVKIGFEYKMRLVYAHFPISVNIENEGTKVEIRNFLGEKRVRIVDLLPGQHLHMPPKPRRVMTRFDVYCRDSGAIGRSL